MSETEKKFKRESLNVKNGFDDKQKVFEGFKKYLIFFCFLTFPGQVAGGLVVLKKEANKIIEIIS